ncbi:hypothetical protein RHSIM_Rhsim12G0068600 [Rhododendron simsii]|uniref:Uncharacterized protein n=1 Tax=Rhododendron simsii TaxID=118357 RepID=A0A834G2K8_RHOSS|nr:hypothetical protein RHSIM_Rhsim12G0068600 [Rhododendron simsii]
MDCVHCTAINTLNRTWTVYTAQQSIHLILLKGEVTGRAYNVAGSIDRLWQAQLRIYWGHKTPQPIAALCSSVTTPSVTSLFLLPVISQNKGNCSDVISIVNCCSQKRSKDFTRLVFIWWKFMI